MPARKPNILWIVTTQWRAQACGYAGDGNARTPVIDALAAQSVNYAQAVTPHPFGPFARAAMLTGVPSPENGLAGYHDSLPVNARTIAHELNEHGYDTAYFGKWQLAEHDQTAPLVGESHARMIVPENQRGGFGFWEGFQGGFLLNDPWLHGNRLSDPRQFTGYQSGVLCERASEYFATAKAPWFGVVSLEAPHPPYAAPAAGFKPAVVQLSPNVPPAATERAKRELAGYYAHIAATDRAIGRLLAGISSEDTVVVFTSVHGDMHGAHGLFRKGWPQEESVRVPLLVRQPGVKAGRDDAAVSLFDLPAMTRAWSDGQTWHCPRDHALISMPSVVELPDQCDRVWRGVRTAKEKLVLNESGEPWLYFDLATDPLEERNRSSDPTCERAIARLIPIARRK